MLLTELALFHCFWKNNLLWILNLASFKTIWNETYWITLSISHCYNFKYFVKFSFKDSSKRSKAHQPNRLSIRKLGYMLVTEGRKVPTSLEVLRTAAYVSSFLEYWPENMALPGLRRANQLTRISDPSIRFEVVLLAGKM